jgi:hypothetical protein
MADVAKFSILTFQRKPGAWRAAITPKDRRACLASPTKGEEILSIVTPKDCQCEEAAALAAREVVKKL